MIKWFENCSNLSPEQYSIFLNIANVLQGDMTVFSKMNDVLENNVREYQYTDEKLNLEFNAQGNMYVLRSSFGDITLDYDAYKTIISKLVDMYSDTYPLGTVVELDKEAFEGIIPSDVDTPLRVVILDRFTQFTDTLYFYYTGVIYPLGNNGVEINAVRFAPMTIKKVIHMGYSDKTEIEYVNHTKRELLFDRGMHSTSILTRDEMELLQVK